MKKKKKKKVLSVNSRGKSIGKHRDERGIQRVLHVGKEVGKEGKDGIWGFVGFREGQI